MSGRGIFVMRLSAAQIGRTARWAARLALASWVQRPGIGGESGVLAGVLHSVLQVSAVVPGNGSEAPLPRLRELDRLQSGRRHDSDGLVSGLSDRGGAMEGDEAAFRVPRGRAQGC